MSVGGANFDIGWDEFMEMAEQRQVVADETDDGVIVNEISEQELLYEIKVDDAGLDRLDLSLFDETMEEVYVLNGVEDTTELPTPMLFTIANDDARDQEASATSPEKQNEECVNENIPEQPSRSTNQNQFVEINNDDFHDFVNEQENKSTLRKTIWDIDKFNKLLRLKGEVREMKDIPPEELDTLVAGFILSVRKADGGEYEPSSIRNMVSSLDRKLRRHSYPESIINSKSAFSLRAIPVKSIWGGGGGGTAGPLIIDRRLLPTKK